MKCGRPNLVGNDLMVENKKLHNKLAMREVSYAEAVQQIISADKYAEEAKIAMFQLTHKVEVLLQSHNKYDKRLMSMYVVLNILHNQKVPPMHS